MKLPNVAASKTLIIIPTLNEVDNIVPLLGGIDRATPGVNILFIDDASKDGTPALIKERISAAPHRLFLIERPGKLGLGTAYVLGFKWAEEHGYDAVVQMDADLSHRAVDLAALLSALQHAPAVIGSRYVRFGGTSNWNFWRRLISRFGSLYARTVLGVSTRDLTGGFNAWRREVLAEINPSELRSEGYSFQIELKYRAHLKGFPLVEIPILFEERREGQSKMSGGIVFEAIHRVIRLKLGAKNLSGCCAKPCGREAAAPAEN